MLYSPLQWYQINNLFHAAMGKDPRFQEEFVRRACRGDEVVLVRLLNREGIHIGSQSDDRTGAGVEVGHDAGLADSRANVDHQVDRPSDGDPLLPYGLGDHAVFRTSPCSSSSRSHP